jgi:hypothetical protein
MLCPVCKHVVSGFVLKVGVAERLMSQLGVPYILCLVKASVVFGSFHGALFVFNLILCPCIEFYYLVLRMPKDCNNRFQNRTGA